MLHSIWMPPHLSQHNAHVGCSAAVCSVASLKCPALSLTAVSHLRRANDKKISWQAASSVKWGMWCVWHV